MRSAIFVGQKRLISKPIVDKFPLNLILEIRFMTDDSAQLEQCIGRRLWNWSGERWRRAYSVGFFHRGHFVI